MILLSLKFFPLSEMEIQTLLFPKRLFGKKEATTWLQSHGYRTDIDNKLNVMRFR